MSANALSIETTPIFSPRRLGHVNLWVDDLKRSETFYSQVCGLAVEFWEPELGATFLGTGHTPHDLGMIEKTDGKPRYSSKGVMQLPGGIGMEIGLNHLAFEVENEEDLVTAFKRLQEAEIPILMTVDHQIAYSIYVFDPDGNQVEYYCDTIKDWRKVLHGEMELISGPWMPGMQEPFTEPRYDDNPTLHRVAAAPIQPSRLTHAVLLSQDIQRMAQFYSSVGGLTVSESDSSEDVVLLSGSHSAYPLDLAICRADRNGYHHVAFELGDEQTFERTLKAVVDNGIVIEEQIDLPWKTSFFLRDPDGLLSEYYVSREGKREYSKHSDWVLPTVI